MEESIPDSLSEDSPQSLSPSLRVKLRPADSQYMYELITTLLENEETRLTITEAEFREYLKEHMASKGVILDNAAIIVRLRTAGEAAKEVQQQEAVVAMLYSQWAHKRDVFTAAQNHRREQRKVRTGRLRAQSTRVVIDSDEEFEEREPTLTCTPLKLAGAAAHQVYAEVRERFAGEREKRKKEASRLSRDSKNEQRRDQRREQLMSSISTFVSSPGTDSSASSWSSSSSSSSPADNSSLVPTPPKRKFSAAGVTESYTKFLASSAHRTSVEAAEVKSAIDREAKLTAEYRVSKLALLREEQKSKEDFRQAVLEELRGGNENRDPNERSDGKEESVAVAGQRRLLSAFMGL
jgi:hypothetical protein